MKYRIFAITMALCLLMAVTGCGAKDKNTHATGGTTDSTIASTEIFCFVFMLHQYQSESFFAPMRNIVPKKH
jgi:hypothetical protein